MSVRAVIVAFAVLAAAGTAISAGQRTAPPRQPGGKPPGEGVSRIATLRSDAPRHAAPEARPEGVVPARWFGRRSVLPVIGRRRGWVRVRLAQRPNGSTAWLRREDVTLGRTPYRLLLDLTAMRLELYRRGRLAMSAPAGVGTPDDPTPTGHYFVAFHQAPPEGARGYGPFIVVTSAHSRSIADWQGSGDAIIGVHGPLGAAGEIGSTGARISHGCVRLHRRDLVRLGDVPPGTPLDILW